MVGELAKSQYAYFLGEAGLFRVNVPDFDQADTPEFKVECVFYDASPQLPKYMGLFSHGHNVYMVGGTDTWPRYKSRHSLYVFDPSRFEEFPVIDPVCLDKPKELRNKFKSMVGPRVIRAEHQIYFLTKYSSRFNVGRHRKPICFQSFDPTKNRFDILPSPPYIRDKWTSTYSECGHFFACGYIYLFIQEDRMRTRTTSYDCLHAFSFSTRSSKWKERKLLLQQFEDKEIPIPFLHKGDVGLSDEFPDNTRILVAFNHSVPTAYRVCLGAHGSIKPKSYRLLEESYLDDGCGCSVHEVRLHDIGGGRFFVTYQGDSTPLMIYVFKIDYALEYATQTSELISPTKPSSEILCSRIFWDRIPLFGMPSFYAVCLAPASQSCNQREDHEVTAAAPTNGEQDRDGKMGKRIEIYSHKRKRKGGENNARRRRMK